MTIIHQQQQTMSTTLFTCWGGPDGICNFIYQQTGCKPYSGAGINPRPKDKTTILKSVDDTYYYDDNLDDVYNVKYTLFGHNGDQDEDERRFNEPLLNENKTQNIYLYRVVKNEKKTHYLWYGKYIIEGKISKTHVGKDMIHRKIIVLSLKKVDD
jgi:hypothetical protein